MPLSVGPPGTVVPAPGVGVPGPVVGGNTATQEFPTTCGKNGVVESFEHFLSTAVTADAAERP